MSARLGGAVKRIAAFILLLACTLLVLKLAVGAVVGFVKMVLAIGLLAVFAVAVFAIWRRV